MSDPIGSEFRFKEAGLFSHLKARIPGCHEEKVVAVSTHVFNEEYEHSFGKGYIAKNEEEFLALLSSREWVPLSDQPVLGCDYKQVVFVSLKQFAQHANPLLLDQVMRILDGEKLGYRIRQVYHAIVASCERKSNDAHLKHSLEEQLQKPFSEEVTKEADAILMRHQKVAVTSEQIGKLEPARIASSETLKADGRKIEGWRQAAHLVGEKARSNQPLLLEDLQEINRLCIFSTTEEELEILKGGQIRENNIFVGGLFAGLCYLPAQFVKESLLKNLDDIEPDLRSMNPILAAAKIAQTYVSIHPFEDANGRTAALLADYVLQRAGLPPASRDEEYIPAIFGEQKDMMRRTPDDAARVLLRGLERSYALIHE